MYILRRGLDAMLSREQSLLLVGRVVLPTITFGSPMRIAAIDIGTNSIHMVIAESVRQTEFAVLDREREVVQVGRGSFEAGRLKGEAVRRTVAALRRFVQLARRHQVDRILCTATAAVREASNGGEFLRAARSASGVSPRVIPAEEEGRLIYLATRAALQLDARPSLIVDIGGGSAQLVVADRERLHQVVSVPLGSLRLTETLLSHDPPTPRELSSLQRHIRKQLRFAFRSIGEVKPVSVFGSSGAIHALAQVANWNERGEGIRQINGHVITAASLERQVKRLWRMSEAQRERLPGLDARRAEIIVPGGLVLLEVLRQARVDQITLSDFGVREGLVTDWLERHAREVKALGPIEDLRIRSALGLLARFGADGPHPRHVAKLALRLFDELRAAHGLDETERELLHYAALLHDVGSVVGYDGHAQHSAYIIRHGALRGLDEAEVEVVASVARYHGKPRPRRGGNADYASLSKGTRRMVKWLSAMLRIAEGLDRSHYQLIRDLRVVRRGKCVSVLVMARRDAQLELWAARRRLEGLGKLLGARVQLGLDPRAHAVRPASESVKPVSRGQRAGAANGTAPPRRGVRTPTA
ncbi:MAG: Ppx/GppA phosphatase family protein [Candidatus Eisenbacteria bacterium]